jgi:hypothetical protein
MASKQVGLWSTRVLTGAGDTQVKLILRLYGTRRYLELRVDNFGFDSFPDRLRSILARAITW